MAPTEQGGEVIEFVWYRMGYNSMTLLGTVVDGSIKGVGVLTN